ncbi:hypothetical protein ABIA39_006563 [Nocardia sp. GAS34]|uniref:hypothetical protein n=1 Tax=unclassified Nocardia TaxID=2637762 RepID=UPI003D1A90C3
MTLATTSTLTRTATIITATTLLCGVVGAGRVAADPAPNSGGQCDLPSILGSACTALHNALKNTVGGTTGELANSVFGAVVKSLLGGLTQVLEWCLDWWITLPSPQLAEPTTGTPGPVLSAVREYTGDLQIYLMTGAIILTGARLAMARRGELVGQTQETFVMFARAVFASWMFAALVAVGTHFGDVFSSWVISDATHGDAAGVVKNMVNFDALTGNQGLGTGAMFLIAIFGLIGALLQLVLLVVRQALLIVVVALIPVAASVSGTGPGSQAYQRLVAWSLAFVLYKPVGALIYVVAFSASSQPNSNAQQTLLGLILLALVAIVMPAIMRLVAPAIATMGGSGMGMLAAGVIGAGIGRAIGGGGSSEDSSARTVDENPTGTGGENGGGNGGGGGGGDGGGGTPSGGAGRNTQGADSAPDGNGSAPPQARQTTDSTGTQRAATESAGAETSAGVAAAGGPWGAAAQAAVETGKKLYAGVNSAASPESEHEVPQ